MLRITSEAVGVWRRQW